MEQTNQLHPPRKKNREKVDLNVRKSVYYKDGTSTMLFCKDITIPAAKVLIVPLEITCVSLMLP